MEAHHRKQAVALVAIELRQRSVELTGPAKRRGALQQHDARGLEPLGAPGRERVAHRRLGGGGVARELRRAADDLGASRDRDVGDLVVVGADEDAIDGRGRARVLDGVDQQRTPRERDEVLARDALAAATRGDERDRGHTRLRSATARRHQWGVLL
ncbi:MAG: hypothetical protein U0168_16705 [Nannocystaceae bacterium]